MSKRKAPWNDSRGPDRFRSQSRRLRLAATGCGSGPLDFCQHGAGLLAGAGVDIVVAEEDLRDREQPGALEEVGEQGDESTAGDVGKE